MMPENLEDNNKGVGVNGNLRPATAGEVRNPLGRPLGSRNRSTIVKEWLEMIGDENLPNVDLVVRAQIIKAITGDTAAFNAVMDSGFGKLTDKQEITGKDGDPLKMDVTALPPDEAYKRIL